MRCYNRMTTRRTISIIIHDTNDPLTNRKVNFSTPGQILASQLMDLSSLPERDRQRVTRLIETKQVKKLYSPS